MGVVSIDVNDAQTVAAIQRMMRAVRPEEAKRIAEYSAEPYIALVEQSAPKATRVVKRYNTAKVFSGGGRAPRGQGTVAAEYHPGNVSKAMQVLNMRRVKSGVLMGLKRARRASGSFGKGKRVDAYYAPMVEYGTKYQEAQPFVRPAWRVAEPIVLRLMTQGLKREINKEIR